MSKHPILWAILAVIVLIAPTVVYLCFLVPVMSAEYNTLMASRGKIGGSGFYGSSKIPDTIKNAGLFKLAANSFSIFIITLLVQKFIVQIIGLAATFVVSFIAFKILMECYRNAKRRKQNAELAEQVARNVAESTK